MKVSVEMLKNLGACGPASIYVGQWFVDNNIEIIDYDLGMAHLKSLIAHGQAWISENISGEDHADYRNWIAWYEKLPTTLEAITYFGDHHVENTFRTLSDGLMHESIEQARAHIERVTHEIKTDYYERLVLNGVIVDNEGNETWVKINNPYKDNLDQYNHFVWHDISTGLNNKTTSRTAAIVYYDSIMNYVDTMIQDYRSSNKIQQLYYDEARKYQVWVTVE